MMNRSFRKAIAAALVIPMCLTLYVSPAAASEVVQTEEAAVSAVDAQSIGDLLLERMAQSEKAAEVVTGEALTGEIATSGVTGDCKWVYDESTKTLTISSNTGNPAAMPDYGSPFDTPWRSLARSVDTVIVDDTVTSIGDCAFSWSSSLKQIEIPDSVTEIGKYAFSGITDLEYIKISKNVTIIGEDAFGFCGNLEIEVDADNPKYSSEDGILYNKDKTTLIVCPAGRTRDVIMPDSVIYIEKYAFYCSQAANVKMSENLQEVGICAFEGSSIENILFHKNIEKLDAGALSGCAYLTEIKFEGNAPEIAGDAFGASYDAGRVVATAYYPQGDSTWTADKLQNYGGEITWVAYDPTTNAASSTGRTVPHYDYRTDGGTWDGTHYYLADGTLATDVFFCDGESTYYLQLDGTPMTNRLTYHPNGVNVIYFDENGHEVFDNFVNVKSSVTGEEVNDICYFNTYGYMYVDFTTYDVSGTNLYYLNAYGVMQQGGWFQFADGNIGYANEDGTLLTSQFSYDQWGRMVYFQGDGTLARGLISDGVNYYQFDETDGHLVGMFPVE